MDDQGKVGATGAAGTTTSKGYPLTVLSTTGGEIRKDVAGADYGVARVRYKTSDGRVRSATAMGRGKGLDACRRLFEGGDYVGPLYGVFVTSPGGQKLSTINLLPPPSMRAAA